MFSGKIKLASVKCINENQNILIDEERTDKRFYFITPVLRSFSNRTSEFKSSRTKVAFYTFPKNIKTLNETCKYRILLKVKGGKLSKI